MLKVVFKKRQIVFLESKNIQLIIIVIVGGTMFYQILVSLYNFILGYDFNIIW